MKKLFLSMLLGFFVLAGIGLGQEADDPIEVSTVNFEEIALDGGDGFDTASIYGSAENLVDMGDGSFRFTDPNSGVVTTYRNFEAFNFLLDVTVTTDEKLPLSVAGETARGRVGTYQPPVTWAVIPVGAGTVDTADPLTTYFVPDAGYEGTATITASALNRKEVVISGQITVTVVPAAAVKLVITAGTPVDN